MGANPPGVRRGQGGRAKRAERGWRGLEPQATTRAPNGPWPEKPSARA